MLAPRFVPSVLISTVPVILQFPTEAFRPVRSLRHMTTQLLQEAAQVIPNQQLLINVVSKRVRQLGLGHRPMVETTPRMSLTDIALKEIIAGKLTYESLEAFFGRSLVHRTGFAGRWPRPSEQGLVQYGERIDHQSQGAPRLSHSRALRSRHRAERQRGQIDPGRQGEHQRCVRANRKRRSFSL